jgi:hypothetical protein
MDDRIRFIEHRGQRILLLDFTNYTASQVAAMSELIPSYVTAEPRGSVLILVDFTGAHVDRNAIEVMKKGMVFDRPHVKRSAWVGADGIPNAYYEALKVFTRRQFPRFPTREAALTYLVGEDQEETQELASPA